MLSKSRPGGMVQQKKIRFVWNQLDNKTSLRLLSAFALTITFGGISNWEP